MQGRRCSCLVGDMGSFLGASELVLVQRIGLRTVFLFTLCNARQKRELRDGYVALPLGPKHQKGCSQRWLGDELQEGRKRKSKHPNGQLVKSPP